MRFCADGRKGPKVFLFFRPALGVRQETIQARSQRTAAPEHSPFALHPLPIILGNCLDYYQFALYIGHMITLPTLGEAIATRRKTLGLSQLALAGRAGVGRSTVDALENARLGELGLVKVARILAAVGLELKLQEAGSKRPTLDELLEEDRHDQDLDGRR